MINKTFAVMAVTAALLTGASAFAENSAVIDSEAAKVTLSFECNGADYALVMIKNRESGEYVYANQMSVSGNILSGEAYLDSAAAGGYYDVIVTDNLKNKYAAEFFLMNEEYRNQLLSEIEEIRNSSDSSRNSRLLKLIEDNKIVFQYDEEKLENLIDKNKLSEKLLENAYTSIDSFASDLRDFIDSLLEEQKITIAVNAFNNASASEMTSVLNEHSDIFLIEFNSVYNKYASDVNEFLAAAYAQTPEEVQELFTEAMAVPYVNEAERAELLDTIRELDQYLGIYDKVSALSGETLVEVLKTLEATQYKTAAQMSADIDSVIKAQTGNEENDPYEDFYAQGSIFTVPKSYLDPSSRPQIIQDMVTDEEIVFYDLGSVPWAKESILALHKMGVIDGRTDTEFAPDELITRAEFVKMLTAAFGTEKGEAEAFADVSDTDWFYDYVMSARSAGIVMGDDYNNFMPDVNVSRQDAAAMIFRCMGADAAADTELFADDADISDYAREAVYSMKQSGIIDGTDGNKFEPGALASRAQCAKMIYSALNKEG